MQKVEQSNFCRDDGEKGWVASFGWFLTEGNALKVLEGTYVNRPYRSKSTIAMQHATEAFLAKYPDRSQPDDEK